MTIGRCLSELLLEWTGAWSVIDRISGLQQPEDGICGLQQGSGFLCTVCDGKILRIIARIPQTQTKLKQNYAIIRKKSEKEDEDALSCTSGLGTEARESGENYNASGQQVPAHYGGGGRFLHAAGAGGNISGALSLSVFTCMNGCYTLGMTAARYCALAGTVRSKERKKQVFITVLPGAAMVAASLLYVAYSTLDNPPSEKRSIMERSRLSPLQRSPLRRSVSMYGGVIKYRKYHSPLLHALKIISLGTSLISLVLTQSAILAFADEAQDPSVNGFLGTVTGICAALLGVYMIRRINRIEAEDLYERGLLIRKNTNNMKGRRSL